MSLKVMTLVWERFPGAGSELLSMLALADWCADDGERLYPSISTLAAKIRVSESQARRVLHGLISDGYIAVIGNENGGAPGTTRQYKIIVEKLRSLPAIEAEMAPTGRTGARGSADARGSMDARDGSHGCAETGSTHATQTVSRTVSKHKEEEVGRARPQKITFDDEQRKLVGIEPATIKLWCEAYPALDIEAEIKRAAAWLHANPKNRKSDYLRFLTNWLNRAQDRAPRVGAPPIAPRGNGRPSMNSFDTSSPDEYADFMNHRREFRQ